LAATAPYHTGSSSSLARTARLQALLIVVACLVGVIVSSEMRWQSPSVAFGVIGLTAVVWLAGAIVSSLVRLAGGQHARRLRASPQPPGAQQHEQLH